MNDNVLTVSQLNLYIKSLLDFDEFMSNVWVLGEISNFKHHSSGHMYMTLKDETSALKTVMFKSYSTGLKFEPENGMKVLVHGRVSVYERDGQYQLYADDMQPYGAGALYVAFEKLKAKLSEEGLFDEKFKKKLPLFPGKIAVVTSRKGAAVHDMINVIRRRYNLCDILVCPVSVQGGDSAVQIAGAIEYINKNTDADLMIVGRGGGSAEDLQCFNEEVVARAIFNSRIPVISAVGHETDFTIADFVADVRAATPSVGAELATPPVSEIKAYIKALKEKLSQKVNDVYKTKEDRLSLIKEKDLTALVCDMTEQKQQYVCDLNGKIERISSDVLEKKRNEFALMNEKLKLLNPLNLLSRGYSIVSKNDETTVKTIKGIRKEDELKIRVTDGVILTKVICKEKK